MFCPLNIQRRVNQEQTQFEALRAIKASNLAQVRGQWEVSRLRTDASTRQRFEDKEIANEVEQGNKELLILRRARMKEFLAAEAAEHERQLNELGLAFAKYRD